MLRQFVEAIYTAAGKKGRVKYGARRGNTEKVIGIEPDISRLLSMIDWRPMISFEEGVGEMVKRIESKPADNNNCRCEMKAFVLKQKGEVG